MDLLPPPLPMVRDFPYLVSWEVDGPLLEQGSPDSGASQDCSPDDFGWLLVRPERLGSQDFEVGKG